MSIKIIKALFAIGMIIGGIHHFISPNLYLYLLPNYIPLKMEFIYLIGLLIIALGIILFREKIYKLYSFGYFSFNIHTISSSYSKYYIN